MTKMLILTRGGAVAALAEYPGAAGFTYDPILCAYQSHL
jgi:hypothetical protein